MTITSASTSAPPPLRKSVFFAGCFALEVMAFAILPLSGRLPVSPLLKVHAGLTATFLVAALLSWRSERGNEYWKVLYAMFVASTAVLLSTLFSGRLLEALPLAAATPSWIAVAKLSESVWRVVPVLLLMAFAGADLRSMYLTKGRLGLGLAVGVAGFVGFAGLSLLPLASQGSMADRLLSLSPWILVFVLANGFTEELLFRGLFLRRYEPFLGKGLSNLLTAVVFTLLHARVTYVSDLARFLLVLFPLALAWGYLTQKTDSLWGSALFHAGADCIIILGIFATG
jgi:membrane protease YdiL (CAAX protease family)